MNTIANYIFDKRIQDRDAFNKWASKNPPLHEFTTEDHDTFGVWILDGDWCFFKKVKSGWVYPVYHTFPRAYVEAGLKAEAALNDMLRFKHRNEK